MPPLTQPVSSHDDDEADYDEHPEDAIELEELTADIATVLAGATMVPVAVMWWRARRERRAWKEASRGAG